MAKLIVCSAARNKDCKSNKLLEIDPTVQTVNLNSFTMFIVNGGEKGERKKVNRTILIVNVIV